MIPTGRLGLAVPMRANGTAAPSASLRMSSIILAVAAMLVLAAVLTGVRAESLKTRRPSTDLPRVALNPTKRKAPTDSALRVASESNLFAPNRLRGGVFTPGVHEPAPAASPAPRPPAVSLIGTAIVAAGRSFVVCTVDGGVFQVVKVGGQCGNLTLKAVERGQGEFRDPGGKPVTIQIPKAGTK